MILQTRMDTDNHGCDKAGDMFLLEQGFGKGFYFAVVAGFVLGSLERVLNFLGRE